MEQKSILDKLIDDRIESWGVDIGPSHQRFARPIFLDGYNFALQVQSENKPLKPSQSIDGPWKAIIRSSKTSTEAGTEYEDWVEITDGKVTLYFDGGIDDGDEHKLVALLNALKIKLDYDHEPEHAAYQYEQLYKEAVARQSTRMKWVKASERLPENKERSYIFRQRRNTRSAKVWYLAFTPNIAAAMQLPIEDIEWLDESAVPQPDPISDYCQQNNITPQDLIKAHMEVKQWGEAMDIIRQAAALKKAGNGPVEFAEWIRRNHWHPQDNITKPDAWQRFNPETDEEQQSSSSDLYTLFLNREK